jgi:hypothetical protein
VNVSENGFNRLASEMDRSYIAVEPQDLWRVAHVCLLQNNHSLLRKYRFPSQSNQSQAGSNWLNGSLPGLSQNLWLIRCSAAKTDAQKIPHLASVTS